MSDLDNDVGRMTFGLRANAKDVYDVWMHLPAKRHEFGAGELQDIRETYLALGILLREMDKQKLRLAHG